MCKYIKVKKLIFVDHLVVSCPEKQESFPAYHEGCLSNSLYLYRL